jgi:hypothetical protein
MQEQTTQSSPVEGGQTGSVNLFRWTGYGLLLLAVIDVVEILFPPRLMNPTWEFQTAGRIIDIIPVPLLALVFVFFGEGRLREKLERIPLKLLSWAALLWGIVLFAMIPLIINNAFRIEGRSKSQVRTQLNEQLSRAQQLEDQLSSAATGDLENYLKRMGRAREGVSVEQSRAQLIDDLAKARRSIQAQAQETLAGQQLALEKNLYKWTVQALISGALFVYVWKTTSWARRMSPRSKR